jgi:hypothetical protein
MKENIALILLTLVFLFGSYVFYICMQKASGSKPLLILLGYLLFTYLLFAASLKLTQYLSEKHIYFDFGHDDELLVYSFFLWAILAIAISIFTALKRIYNKTKNNT